MRLRQLGAIFLCIATNSFAQSTPASVYAESFRQGPTHVVEEKFEVKLTPQDSTYRERIKDSSGADRYALSITPQGPEGDTEITSWQVKLVDLHHPMYDNILLSSQNASSGPKDPLWRSASQRFCASARDHKADH